MAKKKKIVPSLLDEAGNPLPPRTPQQAREALRKLVRLFYDYQRLRIQAGGRSRGTVPREELSLTRRKPAYLNVPLNGSHPNTESVKWKS